MQYFPEAIAFILEHRGAGAGQTGIRHGSCLNFRQDEGRRGKRNRFGTCIFERWPLYYTLSCEARPCKAYVLSGGRTVYFTAPSGSICGTGIEECRNGIYHAVHTAAECPCAASARRRSQTEREPPVCVFQQEEHPPACAYQQEEHSPAAPAVMRPEPPGGPAGTGKRLLI